jgi:6-pyruvoyltetrahydropterin/6-carboxytetrahydropterin synthase
MSRVYQVRVEGVQFAAAHCATIGRTCEPLHGHSYEVAAEIDGTLSEDSWVVDFVELKSILRSIADEIDHRFLLQRESRVISIESRGEQWAIETPEGSCYLLPAADVVALPVDNTTAERLSQWFCEQLWQALVEREADNIRAVAVEVWEGPGQRASHRQERAVT